MYGRNTSVCFLAEIAAKVFEEVFHSHRKDGGESVWVLGYVGYFVLQFHTPSGREEVWCVAYPWCEGGEVVRVKVERVGEASQRQVALEPAEGSSGLFGWNTIASDAKEVGGISLYSRNGMWINSAGGN